MEESQTVQVRLQNSIETNPQKEKIRVSAVYGNVEKDSSQQQFRFTQINDINPIVLLKKPKSYKQCFEFLFKSGGQFLENQNYEQSIQFYEKTLQMLDIGKKVITKQSYPQIEIMKIIIFANLACAFLNIRKLQKCNKFAEKAIEQIEKFLTSAEKQTYLKISITLMVLKFQNCAILSQLQQHERSLQLCKSNLSLIKKYLQLLEIFVHDSLRQSYQKGKSKQTVSFSRQVFKFAALTIKQLLQYIQQPMLKKQEMVFYYWQKNPQKNEQQLLKKFLPMQNQNCKRSILGVSKKNHWIDEFNIGSVMHMMPLKLQELTNIYPIQEYVFKDKLYEITIYCSMCYFTMATQMRFIDSNLKTLSQSSNQQILSPQIYKDLQTSKVQQNKKIINIGNVNLLKKYGYSQKTQMFKRSEIYHLCSIDVMSKVVKYAIPYINHIIRSYEKHYIKQKKLQQIFAIAEESYLQQDTIVNQSIAQYCPFQTKLYEKPINILPPRSFSKNGKSQNTFNAENQKIKFERILQEQEQFQKILIEDFSPNKFMQKKSSQNLESPLQNSGQYLQSVIKKKKSRKSSRVKTEKQELKESKQTKDIKKKVTNEKSPNHSIPVGNPPKPPIKKKKV